MSVIFNIKVTPNLNEVKVLVHRNGEAFKFKIPAAEFMAAIENNDIYHLLVEWFGSDLLPEFDSPIYDNIAEVYKFLKYPNEDVIQEPKKGIARKLLGGLVRPSIVPQALLAHRVSPFADTERVWGIWSETKPIIEKAKREEERLQALQSAQESKLLKSPEAAAFPSQFEALMFFRGVTKKQIRRSFFQNLITAFAFTLMGFFQIYLFVLLVSGAEKSIINLPVLNVFQYVAWPLSLLVLTFCLIMAMIRLWYCALINQRKLEYEYTFMDFVKSMKYIPGDFKDFEVK